MEPAAPGPAALGSPADSVASRRNSFPSGSCARAPPWRACLPLRAETLRCTAPSSATAPRVEVRRDIIRERSAADRRPAVLTSLSAGADGTASRQVVLFVFRLASRRYSPSAARRRPGRRRPPPCRPPWDLDAPARPGGCARGRLPLFSFGRTGLPAVEQRTYRCVLFSSWM